MSPTRLSLLRGLRTVLTSSAGNKRITSVFHSNLEQLSHQKKCHLRSLSVQMGSNSSTWWCGGGGSGEVTPKDASPELLKKAHDRPKEMTDEEWKQVLGPQSYNCARKHDTECAGTGTLLFKKDKGMYICTCCHADLFPSTFKFTSGTGWPSFFDCVPGSIEQVRDTTLGMVRTEVKCKRCDAHLGHVFPDGPQPTGLRYCINSACLKFEEREDLDSGGQ